MNASKQRADFGWAFSVSEDRGDFCKTMEYAVQRGGTLTMKATLDNGRHVVIARVKSKTKTDPLWDCVAYLHEERQ